MSVEVRGVGCGTIILLILLLAWCEYRLTPDSRQDVPLDAQINAQELVQSAQRRMARLERELERAEQRGHSDALELRRELERVRVEYWQAQETVALDTLEAAVKALPVIAGDWAEAQVWVEYEATRNTLEQRAARAELRRQWAAMGTDGDKALAAMDEVAEAQLRERLPDVREMAENSAIALWARYVAAQGVGDLVQAQEAAVQLRELLGDAAPVRRAMAAFDTVQDLAQLEATE